LEKELGMTQPKKTGHPLESIAENAKQLLSGVLPGNLKIPSNEELNLKLETAFKDPLVSETLGHTVNSLMNAKNLGEGLGMAMKSLENPKFMDGLMRAVQTIIPAETLETIVKSTESLKESGEMKDALGKLGLGDGDVDLSKTLGSLVNNLNLSDLTSSLGLPAPSGESVASDLKDSPTSPGLQISELSKLSMDDALSTLMKNVPPELLNALTKHQNAITQGQTQEIVEPKSETSLIDL